MRVKLLLILVLLIKLLSAQTLIKGPIYENRPYTGIYVIKSSQLSLLNPVVLGEDSSNVYAVEIAINRSSDVFLVVEGFNKHTLERVYSKKHELNVTTVNEIEEIYLLNDKIVLFSSEEDVRDWKYVVELTYTQIDIKTGEKEKTDTVLSFTLEDTPIVTTQKKLNNRLGRFKVHASRNGKRVLVNYVRKDYEVDRFFNRVILFDEEMNILYDKEFIKEREEDIMQFTKLVDDEGSIYYIGDNNKLVFLDYYKGYEKWTEPILLDEIESNVRRKIYATMGFNPAGNAILVAPYVTIDIEDTEENKEKKETKEGDTQLEGLIFMEVDGFNKELKLSKTSKFNQSFIDEFKSDWHIKKELEAEVNDEFNSFDFYYPDKSTTLVIGEAFDYFDDRVYQNDLIVCTFSDSGQLVWAHRIRKLQRAHSAQSSGYLYFSDKKYAYVLIQDHKKNIEDNKRTNDRLRPVINDNYVVPILYKFDLKTGEVSYEIKPQWNGDEDFKAYPGTGYQKKLSSPIYIFLQSRDEYQLAKITFEQLPGEYD